MKNKEAILFLILFTTFHSLLAALTWMSSFTIVMAHADTAIPFRVYERMLLTFSNILLYPIVIPTGNSTFLREALPAYSAPFMLLFNSFIWAGAAYGVIRLFRRYKLSTRTMRSA